ncbi:MAG: 3-isopropylmalate dehydratase large subunit [Anaerolineales bacterium]|nr:3-isopropylmalate dehydratase large subunit [Chloroflexota bacterium]MBL6982492.1 3-isopropylmalate dehydratase large subunit [Anaerolineales bacterium]
MAQTFAEKILAKKAGLDHTVPGQIVEITPDVALSHDNTAPIYGIFQRMGGERVYAPKMHAIFIDHAAPAPTTKHAENHRIIREIVADQGIEYFFDVGRGICHQVLVEEGLALPGEVVLGSDSHTPHAGVMGAFGAGIGRSEMASIWAVGSLWLRVPESMKITVNGEFHPGVTAKDLALKVIGDLGADGALYMSVEWHGEAIETLDLSQRATLPNMMAEMGAKNSYIPPDEKVIAFLDGRAKRTFEAVYPDPDANYDQSYSYDAGTIEPMIACPHTVDNVKPLSAVAGTNVDQAFLGTCTNGRLDDLAAAAEVLKGNKIATGTRMVVIPASSQVYLDALKAGHIETFLEAGAIIESPGCGPCMGNHMGVPAVGEVSISTANRNFRGRMGTKESDVYLASPAVVAASAVAGEIVHPKDL